MRYCQPNTIPEHDITELSRPRSGRKPESLLARRSIRTITDADFRAITVAGLAGTLDPVNTQKWGHGQSQLDAKVEALIRAPREEQERSIVQMLVNRPLRDAAFRTSVVKAYRETCAVTRLRIVNGGGRAEGSGSARPVRSRRRPRYRGERHCSLGDLPLAV